MNQDALQVRELSPASRLAAPPMVRLAGLVPSRLADYAVLVKARLSLMVLLVAAIGFCLGSPGPIDAALLAHTLLGTALVAFGANALNQYMERNYDRLMLRTADRPLPAGRLSPAEGLLVGVCCAVGGFLQLAWFVALLPAFIAALTLGLYLAAYTPLKRVTVWNTLVGAVPGALPPVIGYAAARGRVDGFAILLFAIVFFWQMPHFYAIAWMYREDYVRGGYRMLSGVDPDGRAAGRHAVVYSIALIVVAALPAVFGWVGQYAWVGSILFGGAMLVASARLFREATYAAARTALWTSLVYLPAVMALLLVDRIAD